MDHEEVCGYCGGSGSTPIFGSSCWYCDGTGIEDEEKLAKNKTEEIDGIAQIKEKLVIPEPHIKIDVNGISFKDKEGNWSDPIKPFVNFNSITVNHSNGKTIKGEKGVLKPVGLFDEFMEAIEAEETGRPIVKHLLVWSVDELLDLHNDYKQLYDLFKDEEYLLYMKDVLKVIKAKTN